MFKFTYIHEGNFAKTEINWPTIATTSIQEHCKTGNSYVKTVRLVHSNGGEIFTDGRATFIASL